MTFVGRTFEKFKNINMIQPQESLKLSQILKDHHIYIFCSKLEACSNSLLEAIHCGLAIIARNSSSNPELMKNSGLCFDKKNIIKKIEEVANNLSQYRNKNILPKINQISKYYSNFCLNIFYTVKEKKYKTKKISLWNLFIILTIYLINIIKA